MIPASPVVAKNAATESVCVWDFGVRIGHWLIVAAFTVGYLTAEEESDGPDFWHVWSGYVIGGVILLRLIWGFVGPQHARFSDFVTGPRMALRYIWWISCKDGRVVIKGPFATANISLANSPFATAYAEQRGAERDSENQTNSDNDESAVGELHGLLANLTLALVALHITGVVLASFVHRENLLTAMITGRKRRSD